MRGLRLRLLVILVAMSLIGLSLVDVAFILWAQGQISRERTAALRAAAYACAAALHDAPAHASRGAWLRRLVDTAYAYDVVITAMDRRGGRVSTGEVSLPPQPFDVDQDRVVHRGFEHVVVAMPQSAAFRGVIASQPLQTVVDRVLVHHRSAVAVLALVAIIMVLAGFLFLRRAVIRPIRRMTELVGAGDYDALLRFGGSDPAGKDELTGLGRAIIGMIQRIEQDRRSIQEQLEALRVAHRELEATGHQLVRAERLAVVGQLAAGIAHEIGNPLAIVSGYFQMLQDQVSESPQAPLGEEARDTLERMTKELGRMQSTVRSFLDFSRAKQAQGVGDVREALEQVQTLIKARMRDTDLEIDTPAHLPSVAITTDALTQVLLNLLLNAADATSGQSERGRVRVTVGVEDSVLVSTVEDSGPGIAPEDVAQIFEPFFTSKEAGAGTGLGLCVCERVVTAAGGDIQVDESPLGGARFTVTLPLASERET